MIRNDFHHHGIIIGMKLVVPTIIVILGIITKECQGASPEIFTHPSSVLVPMNAIATFECTAQCTEECEIIWYTEYYTVSTQGGFNVTQGSLSGINGMYMKQLSVNASASVNNTRLWCIVENTGDVSQYARSDTALLLVMSDSLVTPNPSIIFEPMSVTLKWCPPYLWTGYRIKHYTVSAINGVDGTIIIYDHINATFNDSIVAFKMNLHECTELVFRLFAVSIHNVNLQSYEETGGYQQAPGNFEAMAISTTVLFFANTTPIVRLKIQLPSLICDYQSVNYIIIVDSVNESNIIEHGPFHHRGPGTVQNDVMSDRLIRDEEYSVRIILFTHSYTVASNNYSFNTTFLPEVLSIPHDQVCIDGAHPNHNHVIRSYHVVLGVCACVTFIILSLATLVTPVWIYRHWKLHRQTKMDGTSAERMCNAMVPNPIYSGPLYESVQPHFETLTSTTTSTCGEQQHNSRDSTPTSSEKSVRYVDPPSHLPKNRSKSFVSSGPFHSSLPTVDAANTLRSTSVSMPAIKKSSKQRNKFNLTLTLSGTDSNSTTGSRHAQNSTTEPISAVNPVVLRDVDENYTVMSPANVPVGTAKLSELSPEDTDKYKE